MRAQGTLQNWVSRPGQATHVFRSLQGRRKERGVEFGADQKASDDDPKQPSWDSVAKGLSIMAESTREYEIGGCTDQLLAIPSHR